MNRLIVGSLGLALGVAAGCASDGSTSDTVGSGVSTSTVGDETVDERQPPDSEPAIRPGGVSGGQVTVADITVDYVTVVPEGFEPGDEAPVLFAFPPGGQDLDVTRSVVGQTYRDQAVARGWVVISPAAPGGQLYFQGSETLVGELLDWVDTWVTAEGGKVHLAGISNGGLSAFRVAGQNPERVASLLVFPGYARADADQAALAALTEIPVRMFAGGEDTGWVVPMEETAAELEELGGDVELEIFPGEGHIVGALRDGVRVFDELDSSR